MSRLPPHSHWPSRLVVTSRSGATPSVPMNGVIGQAILSLKCSVPSRVVPTGARRVLNDPGRVVARQFRPAHRLAQWTDRNPGVTIDENVFEGDDEEGP